ncbi:MAG: hypothetical protein AAF583_01550 [Pseudomonadota bacterium]
MSRIKAASKPLTTQRMAIWLGTMVGVVLGVPLAVLLIFQGYKYTFTYDSAGRHACQVIKESPKYARCASNLEGMDLIARLDGLVRRPGDDRWFTVEDMVQENPCDPEVEAAADEWISIQKSLRASCRANISYQRDFKGDVYNW